MNGHLIGHISRLNSITAKVLHKTLDVGVALLKTTPLLLCKRVGLSRGQPRKEWLIADVSLGGKENEIIQSYRRNDKDTGSPEVQVALLTTGIQELTDHLRTHSKDHASRRGLLMMVSKRNSLLKYLKGRSRSRYQEVITPDLVCVSSQS